MTTIAHGIGWLWTGVLLVAGGLWAVYLAGRAMGYALRRVGRRLREAWERGASVLVSPNPLALLDAEREARAEFLAAETPSWQRDAERKAVAARITEAERARWDEADRRYLESLASTFARGIR